MQFQRRSKIWARLAIDVRCFGQVVWEIGLQDAAARGAHMFLFFAPCGWQEPLLVTLHGQGGAERVEVQISRWIEGSGSIGHVAKCPSGLGPTEPKAVRARSISA
jgi:hypothetical protein